VSVKAWIVKADKETGSLFTADCRSKRKADMARDSFAWWKFLTNEDW